MPAILVASASLETFFEVDDAAVVGRLVGKTREFRSDEPSVTLEGGATLLNIRFRFFDRFRPNFAIAFEDNLHSLIACKKYFEGVPTLPFGAIEGGLNSDKLLRSIPEDTGIGNVKHLEVNSTSSRSVQCFV